MKIIILFLFSTLSSSCAFGKHSLGFRMPLPEHRIGETPYVPPQGSSAVVPDSYDLRALGFIGPVRDQGNCGSCWAFGSVAVLESMAAKKFGKLVDLSEQEVVSCATQDGVMGCMGGTSTGAFKYSMVNPLVNEGKYPYTSGDSGSTGKCQHMHHRNRLVSAAGGARTVQNEDDIKAALVNEGAVAIAISADNSCFMNYSGGILNPDNCSCNGDIDHLIAVVGYDTEAGQDYWIIRNSWGEGWGEKGYVRFKRGVNMCRMMSYASLPGDVVKTKYFPGK